MLRVERIGAHADVRAGLDAARIHLRCELPHAGGVVAPVLEGDLELDVEHRLEVDADAGIDDGGDARHARHAGLKSDAFACCSRSDSDSEMASRRFVVPLVMNPTADSSRRAVGARDLALSP